MKRRTKIILTLLIVASTGIGVWYVRRSDPEAGVVTETVRRGSVAQTVSVTGKLVPAAYADLSFRRTGRIAAVSVSEGDHVEAGQEIASLDDESLRSDLKAALIALSIAEENEKLARRDWDGLKPEERSAKKLATEQARETVRSVGVSMKDLALLSPISGTVSILDLRSGETAVVGAQVARISGADGLLIESQVPESDVAKIVAGMKTKITFDSLSQQDVFEAELTGIDEAATVSQGVVSYTAKFRMLSSDSRLREGMTANIDIETARAENALVVPFRSLSREGGSPYAEVRRGENVYEKVPVTTGIEGDDGTVEVKSGLTEGDVVVVSRK